MRNFIDMVDLNEAVIEGIRFSRPNPTASTLLLLAQQSRDQRLRGIFDNNGLLIWWDAYDATHDQAAALLGIDYGYSGYRKRAFATFREDGYLLIDHDHEDYTPFLRPLAESAARSHEYDFLFTAWRGTWSPTDFLEQLDEL